MHGGNILVINGEMDLVFRIGQDRFLEGVDKVTRRMIRRAGHLSNVDQPEVFTSLVEEFIASLDAWREGSRKALAGRRKGGRRRTRWYPPLGPSPLQAPFP